MCSISITYRVRLLIDWPSYMKIIWTAANITFNLLELWAIIREEFSVDGREDHCYILFINFNSRSTHSPLFGEWVDFELKLINSI